MTPGAVTVRKMRASDLVTAVRIHREVLEVEFLSSCGNSFLKRYYRAWMDSPDGVAVCAVDGRDQVVGALLGSVEPATHYRSMLRTGGVGIALRLAAHAIAHPRFGRELFRTRAKRYTLGVVRALSSRFSLIRARGGPGGDPAMHPQSAERIGEITHVLVDPGHQGGGVGRSLMDAMEERAREANLDTLVLVTPPDGPARQFYERLGWQLDGDVVSGSEEHFVRYRLTL